MDDLDNSKGFLKHVFNFDDESKGDILNLLQYIFIGLIPIVLLNKSMQKYVPELDEKKGSIEITSEVLIQLMVMFMGLFLIHRIITFVPTYSGIKYHDIRIIFTVLPVLMITLSLQTKLGEKVAVLVDRVYEYINGEEEDKKKKKNGNGNVKVSQPIAGQMVSQPVNKYTDGTAISALPTNDVSQTQQLPDYDNMYRQDTTPLVGAASPGMGDITEPMAANSVLGNSGGFSSW
jgi:hypothetical protein